MLRKRKKRKKVVRLKALIDTKLFVFILHFGPVQLATQTHQSSVTLNYAFIPHLHAEEEENMFHNIINDWRKKRGNFCFTFIFTVIRRKIRVFIFSLKRRHFLNVNAGTNDEMFVNVRSQQKTNKKSFDKKKKMLVAASGFGLKDLQIKQKINSFICLSYSTGYC